MKMPFVNLKAQADLVAADVQAEIAGLIAATSFIQGPAVKKLEESLSAYTGAKHAIACSSGTDALLLALMAYDLQPGDEVITTPFTFVATAEVVRLIGCRLVFVDIEKDTYNLDPAKVEEAITPRTRAIVPVSLFGQCADMKALAAISQRHGIPLIEDAAQSFGAEYQGVKSCNLSPIACTSFYPSKPLGCYGDGGALFTSDDQVAEKLRSLLNHGQARQYVYEYVGINGRLDAFQAAVLNVKLKRFSQEIIERQRRAANYSEGLNGTQAVLPVVKSDRTSVWAQYSIRVPDRQRFQAQMAERGIPTAVFYPIPLHLQKPYLQKGDFKVCEEVAQDIVSLPMCAYLTPQDQQLVVDAVREVL